MVWLRDRLITSAPHYNLSEREAMQPLSLSIHTYAHTQRPVYTVRWTLMIYVYAPLILQRKSVHFANVLMIAKQLIRLVNLKF